MGFGLTKIGRGQNNDYFLDSVKLKNFISRYHAEIMGRKNENGEVEFVLTDKGLNGTFINDYRVCMCYKTLNDYRVRMRYKHKFAQVIYRFCLVVKIENFQLKKIDIIITKSPSASSSYPFLAHLSRQAHKVSL